jgi:hypothetical protein
MMLLALAMGAAGGGCAGGGQGGGSGGGNASGGSNGSGGSNSGSGGVVILTGSGGNGSGGSSSSGGNTGSGGSVSSGGSTGSGGSGSGGSSSGGNTGSGGNTSGSGGSTSSGGNTGSGGNTSSGGASGTGGAKGGSSGAGGTAGATGTGGAAGAGGGGGCPSDATFCSGFETTGLPTGAVYNANAAPGDWSRDFAVDTAQHHSGSSSLRVKVGESGNTGQYQMLAVPATPTAFWARFWIMSSIALGSTEHDAFAAASVGSGPNDLMIEFAEDDGIAFNTKDQDCFPTVGCTGQHPTTPYTIPGGTWQCIEISYDISTQTQQLYLNGSLLINAPNYPGSSVATSTPYFKFGYDAYHSVQRQLWYDDVVVAPTRIGCQ